MAPSLPRGVDEPENPLVTGENRFNDELNLVTVPLELREKAEGEKWDGVIDPRAMAEAYFDPLTITTTGDTASMFRSDTHIFGDSIRPFGKVAPTEEDVKILNEGNLNTHYVYHKKILDAIRTWFAWGVPFNNRGDDKDRETALRLITLFQLLLDGCGLPGATGYTQRKTAPLWRKASPSVYAWPFVAERGKHPTRWSMWSEVSKDPSGAEITLYLLSVDAHRRHVVHDVDAFWVVYISPTVGVGSTIPEALRPFMEELHEKRSLVEFWTPSPSRREGEDEGPLTHHPLGHRHPVDYASWVFSPSAAALIPPGGGKAKTMRRGDKVADWDRRMGEFNAMLRTSVQGLVDADPPISPELAAALIEEYRVPLQSGNPSTWYGRNFGGAVESTLFKPPGPLEPQLTRSEVMWCKWFVVTFLPEFMNNDELWWWKFRINSIKKGTQYPGDPKKWAEKPTTGGLDAHVSTVPYLSWKATSIPSRMKLKARAQYVAERREVRRPPTSPRRGGVVIVRLTGDEEAGLPPGTTLNEMSGDLVDLLGGEVDVADVLLALQGEARSPPASPPIEDPRSPLASPAIVTPAPRDSPPQIEFDPDTIPTTNPRFLPAVQIPILSSPEDLSIPVPPPSLPRGGEKRRAEQEEAAKRQRLGMSVVAVQMVAGPHRNGRVLIPLEGKVIPAHALRMGVRIVGMEFRPARLQTGTDGPIHVEVHVLPGSNPRSRIPVGYFPLPDSSVEPSKSYAIQSAYDGGDHLHPPLPLEEEEVGGGKVMLTPQRLYPPTGSGHGSFRINGTLHTTWTTDIESEDDDDDDFIN